jgi:hypothetical protein
MIERRLLLTADDLSPRRLWFARIVLVLGLATVISQLTGDGARLISDPVAATWTVIGTLLIYPLMLNMLAIDLDGSYGPNEPES